MRQVYRHIRHDQLPDRLKKDKLAWQACPRFDQKTIVWFDRPSSLLSPSVNTLHFALIDYWRRFRMASGIPSPTRRDRFITVTISVMIALLLCAFAASWMWWRHTHPASIVPDYVMLGPLVVTTEAYSVSAHIALQSGDADVEWVRQHDAALRKVLTSTLMTLQPQQVHAPGGLAALQRQLLEAIHRQLSTNKIEQLLLTDFILQTDV